MEAGELLISILQRTWYSSNLSGNKVRIAQYISMMPAQEDNEPLRQWRIAFLERQDRTGRVCISRRSTQSGSKRSMRLL
jgi:hypothetical protein